MTPYLHYKSRPIISKLGFSVRLKIDNFGGKRRVQVKFRVRISYLRKNVFVLKLWGGSARHFAGQTYGLGQII